MSVKTYRVVKAPDPVLLKRAVEIDNVNDNIRAIMDSMSATMYKEDGCGLAANQVGILQRIIIVDTHDKQKKEMGIDFPIQMANPVVVESSDKKTPTTEGCISIPGVAVEVMRPESIVVEYLDYNNKKQKLKTNDLLAKVIQHEIDHLNGKLLINYLSYPKRVMVLNKLRKLKQCSM